MFCPTRSDAPEPALADEQPRHEVRRGRQRGRHRPAEHAQLERSERWLVASAWSSSSDRIARAHHAAAGEQIERGIANRATLQCRVDGSARATPHTSRGPRIGHGGVESAWSASRAPPPRASAGAAAVPRRARSLQRAREHEATPCHGVEHAVAEVVHDVHHRHARDVGNTTVGRGARRTASTPSSEISAFASSRMSSMPSRRGSEEPFRRHVRRPPSASRCTSMPRSRPPTCALLQDRSGRSCAALMERGADCACGPASEHHAGEHATRPAPQPMIRR